MKRFVVEEDEEEEEEEDDKEDEIECDTGDKNKEKTINPSTLPDMSIPVSRYIIGSCRGSVKVPNFESIKRNASCHNDSPFLRIDARYIHASRRALSKQRKQSGSFSN